MARRVARLDWDDITRQLDRNGYAVLPPVVEARTAAELRGCFADDATFRSTVDMARHGFGEGRYRYFAYPLPPIVAALRRAFYAPLSTVANAWNDRLGAPQQPYPDDLAAYLARCHAVGQERPTPLLLRYRSGDWNALHQDLYGTEAFPLQVVVALSDRHSYRGGELLMVEQAPRRQSRGSAVTLECGEVLIFPNRYRPVTGRRGHYRVSVRHGVSVVRSGERLALGLVFHDAA